MEMLKLARERFGKLSAKFAFAIALVVFALVGGYVPAAQADVPTGVQTVFTSAATDFGTIVGYGWVLFLTVVGGLIMFGLVSKVIHRSTRS